MIILNQVKCLKCGDEPFSRTVHDFKYCKCGNVAVDGGQEYLRRVCVGDAGSYRDLSFSLDDDIMKACRDAAQWGLDSGRNAMGIANAVIRALEKNGRLVTDEKLTEQQYEKQL